LKVTINQKGSERWAKGHPWIFRGDLASVEKEQAGPAQVYGDKGKLLGEVLYSPKSLIALRRMTEGTDRITPSLLRNRLETALRLRQEIYPDQSAYRLAFGEADGLPSLIVDRFGDVVSFQTLSAGMETFKESIVGALREMLNPRSIVERNDAVVREKEGLPLIKQVAWGDNPAEVQIQIGGRSFGFDPLEGQKTGFFLDQRWNAVEAGKFLHGEVLDGFCYVGQFGIQSKAAKVTFVDASAPALAQAGKNAEANAVPEFDLQEANAFDYLKDCDKQKRRFDGISLDPPAFVKNRASLKGAIAGYKEINLRAMRLLNSGGILVTSSCSQNLSREDFEKMLAVSARDARRRVQILAKLGQPADHPTLLTMQESEYLKCYILRVE